MDQFLPDQCLKESIVLFSRGGQEGIVIREMENKNFPPRRLHWGIVKNNRNNLCLLVTLIFFPAHSFEYEGFDISLTRELEPEEPDWRLQSGLRVNHQKCLEECRARAPEAVSFFESFHNRKFTDEEFLVVMKRLIDGFACVSFSELNL
jgi:hypothetical protein